MAKDVLITPASGKLEVKADNGTTVETKIEDGNIVLTGTLTASGYNDSNWNTSYSHSQVSGGIHNSGTVTSVATGGGLSGGTITTSGTLSHADTSSQGSMTTLATGWVVADIDLDTYGHVTNLSSRLMTLADLGYTGHATANYITNNNQLTNGANYITYQNASLILTGTDNQELYSGNESLVIKNHGHATAGGILNVSQTGGFLYQLYGTTSSVYGFLDSAWGNWDIKKTLGG
ncbi:uncharacterized protein METZ01_LOCUS305229, partial [marine metagenome]